MSPASIAAPPARRIYFPNLDGLRFLAFFAVFLFHSFYTTDPVILHNSTYQWARALTRSGDLGVNFFFVLSGFLITYLLLSERELTGRIAIGAFYVRRILRIWPLYFVIVFLGFIVLPVARTYFGQHELHETAKPGYFLLFLANFNNLYYGCQTPTLTVLWSVCVEEQFYLVWPLLIATVPNRYLGWLFGSLLVGNLLFRAGHQTEYMLLNWHTFSVIGDMALGGLVAWLCFRNEKLTTAIAALPRWAIGLGYLLGIALLTGRAELLRLPGYIVFDRLVLAIFFAFVLLEQNYARQSFVKMAQLRWLSYWGNYTYGLYCLHFMALLAAYQLLHRLGLNTTVAGVLFGDNALGLALAMLVSWLSFTYYEKPFLKLKNRFAFIKTH
ncbi:MAG: acyltransferase family protein [Janthinobacterium lividum]